MFIVFQEFSLADHIQKDLPGNKMVMHAVLLAGTGLPGGGGDGKYQVPAYSHDLLEYGAFAHTGGAGNYEELPFAHSSSSSISGSSRSIHRACKVSGWMADRIT